jgi:hypothetical protein
MGWACGSRIQKWRTFVTGHARFQENVINTRGGTLKLVWGVEKSAHEERLSQKCYDAFYSAVGCLCPTAGSHYAISTLIEQSSGRDA